MEITPSGTVTVESPMQSENAKLPIDATSFPMDTLVMESLYVSHGAELCASQFHIAPAPSTVKLPVSYSTHVKPSPHSPLSTTSAAAAFAAQSKVHNTIVHTVRIKSEPFFKNFICVSLFLCFPHTDSPMPYRKGF